MKAEDHAKLIHEIRANLTDEAKVTDLLTKLSDDYGSVLAETDDSKKTAEKLTKANEDLRDVNMRLFLKVGNPSPESNTPGNNKGEEKLSFDNLFNEKGGLK